MQARSVGQECVAVSGQLSLDGFAAADPQAYSLFFALMPDAAAAGRAAEVAAQVARDQGVSVKTQRAARFHVTLFHVGHFLGDVPSGTLAAARSVAAGVSAPCFDVSFTRVGSFTGRPGNLPIVLLGGDAEPMLMAFQSTLQDRLLRAGLTAGVLHKTFNPHLTLFYGRQPLEERAIEPIQWRADSFVLLRSVIGQGRYIEEGRWPLQALATSS